MTKATKSDCLFFAGLSAIMGVVIVMTFYVWENSVYLSIPALIFLKDRCTYMRDDSDS